MGIVPDNSVHHDQHALALGHFAEYPQCLAPIRPSLRYVERQSGSHSCSRFDDADIMAQRTDKRDRPRKIHLCVLAVPILTLLTMIHRVEKIRTGPGYGDITDGSEIWNGDGLFGRRQKKQESKRRVSGLGEFFKLLERRCRIAALLFCQGGGTGQEIFNGYSRTLDRPCDELSFHPCANHHRLSSSDFDYDSA